MPNDIGDTLKKYRNDSKITVKQISDILLAEGYKATESTIYSWENGNSQPTPGALLTMCRTYGITDILSAFGYNGYNDDGSILLNIKEIEMVEKYRFISEHSPEGKETVDYILNRELKIAEMLQNNAEAKRENVFPSVRLINYYYRLASAGTGQILFDMPPTKRIEIPDIPKYRKVDYAIGVNGNSMKPKYCDGDMLLVEMADEIEIGEIGIFSVNGECYVKELGKGELISLNPKYNNIPLNETAKCMGKVIGKL